MPSDGRRALPQWPPPSVQKPTPVIKLGMSTALSSPASFLGINMRFGVLAAVVALKREINALRKKLGMPVKYCAPRQVDRFVAEHKG